MTAGARGERSGGRTEIGTGPGAPGARQARPRVAVIGAGLTGLATAWHLRDEAEVTLFDAADRVGGQILTTELAGVPIDVGADAFLARQPEAEDLVRSVGFGDDDLVAPATGRVQLWVGGRLRPFPEATVLGVPTSLRAVAGSGALGPAGLVRAALEPLVPRRQVVGDRSVADLIGERFGREVVQTLVEPLLGGVYAGNTERLSAAATVPPVWAAARDHRSLTAVLRAHRARAADDPRPVFLTLRDGLGALTARLHDQLGDRVRTSTRVTGLAPVGTGWEVATAPVTTVPGPGAVEAPQRAVYDAVVLTVPAAVAARLLRTVDPEVSRDLTGIRTASVGVVALAYDPADARSVPRGSGVLVPRSEDRLIKAVTISSRKWPHHRDRAGSFRLRASVGRVDDATALDLDDATLAERVDAEVRSALQLPHPARERVVVRWPEALPQYDVGHLARVDRIRYGLADRRPGLQVGGAALDGVGLAARARDAGRLAHEVRHHLGTSPR